MAGAEPPVAARLGVAMLALQAGIGALNDVVDASHDAGRKPGKPIPAGSVSRTVGVAVAALGAVAGLGLSAPSGAATLAVGIVILAIGALYDLRLKGTPWSWLPFALGIPLLPVFAWLGSGSAMPVAFVALVPAAALAGAALAIGNALVDVERDRAAGITSIAEHLGARRAWRAMTGLYVAVIAIALATALGASSPSVAVAIGLPSGVVLAGAALSASRAPTRRERGWQLQAIGVALLGAGWLAATLLR